MVLARFDPVRDSSQTQGLRICFDTGFGWVSEGLQLNPTFWWLAFSGVNCTVVRASPSFDIVVERVVDFGQRLHDVTGVVESDFFAVQKPLAFEAKPFKALNHAGLTRCFDNDPKRSWLRALRRVTDMWWKHEDFSFAHRHIVDFATVGDFDHHIAFDLIEPFFDRIVMEVTPCCWTTDHH